MAEPARPCSRLGILRQASQASLASSHPIAANVDIAPRMWGSTWASGRRQNALVNPSWQSWGMGTGTTDPPPSANRTSWIGIVRRRSRFAGYSRRSGWRSATRPPPTRAQMIPWSSHSPDDSTIPPAAPAVNSECAGHEQGTHNSLVGGSSPPAPQARRGSTGGLRLASCCTKIECAPLAPDWTRVGEDPDADRGSMSLRGR
jgi:hypothetical protein